MLNPEILTRVKRLIVNSEETSDDVLNDFLYMFDRAICLHTGTDNTPKELEFVLIELVIARINKMGDEGLKSESIDIITKTYEDDIFIGYLPYIEQWKSLNTPSSGKPRIRVL